MNKVLFVLFTVVLLAAVSGCAVEVPGYYYRETTVAVQNFEHGALIWTDLTYTTYLVVEGRIESQIVDAGLHTDNGWLTELGKRYPELGRPIVHESGFFDGKVNDRNDALLIRLPHRNYHLPKFEAREPVKDTKS